MTKNRYSDIIKDQYGAEKIIRVGSIKLALEKQAMAQPIFALALFWMLFQQKIYDSVTDATPKELVYCMKVDAPTLNSSNLMAIQERKSFQKKKRSEQVNWTRARERSIFIKYCIKYYLKKIIKREIDVFY